MMRLLGTLVLLASLLMLRESPAQDALPKLKFITGEVAQVDDKSIAIKRRKLVDTFPLSSETKILIQTEGFIDIGNIRSPKNAIGKIADLKVGQQVTAACAADGKLVEIVVLRPKGK